MHHSLAFLQKSRTSPPALLDHPCNLNGVCAYCVFHISRAEEKPRTCTNVIVRLTNKHVRTYSSYAGTSRSAASFTGSVSNIFQCLRFGVLVTFKLLSRVGFSYRRGGTFCDVQISADVLSRIHHRRMDQSNHNLLMAVGGWGVLLSPCYFTAVRVYHSVP